MSPRIVHFGTDDPHTVPILVNGGYRVEACGTSVSRLRDSLARGTIDAVAVIEEGTPDGVDVVAITRSLGITAPLVLFEDWRRKLDPLQFDAVVSLHESSEAWLCTLAKTIGQARMLRKQARRLKAQSAELRVASAATRGEAVAKREQARREAKGHDELSTANIPDPTKDNK